MNCEHAQPFVSGLYDGEAVPAEAVEHIRNCPVCRQRLRDYAEMGAELRLLANTTLQETPPDLNLPPDRKLWGRRLTDRVLVPRFAIGLALITIVGLSVGLGLTRGQASGSWFQFDIRTPYMNGSSGFLVKAGESVTGESPLSGPGKKIAFTIRALDVRTNLVRMEVRARTFTPPAGNVRHLDRILADTAPQRLDYVPGQKLKISVKGAGNITLTGKVYRLRPTFWGFPVTPKPDEIGLADAAIVRDHDFLGSIQGASAATVQASNSAMGICAPPYGALVIALKPFPNAKQGIAEYGQIRFEMDNHHYTLYSALPITGGPQPRTVWVYRAARCPQQVSVPLLIGVGDVSDVLKEVAAKTPHKHLQR